MNNHLNQLTVVAQVPEQARFLRLPRTGERDAVFGLSRSFLNTLILPCRQNGYAPLVRSVVIRKPGAHTGVRLVDLESLREYVHAHVEPAFKGQPPQQAGAYDAGI
jgi:hypothetical protein